MSRRDSQIHRGGGVQSRFDELNVSQNEHEFDLPQFELHDGSGLMMNDHEMFDGLSGQVQPGNNRIFGSQTISSIFSPAYSMETEDGGVMDYPTTDTRSSASDLPVSIHDLNLANFLGIEDLFASSHASSSMPPPSLQPAATHTPEFRRASLLSPSLSPFTSSHEEYADQSPTGALLDRDQEYLRSQDCFSLPPILELRKMSEQYFKFIHPNLPVLAEEGFWGLWEDNNFNPGDFSLLVLQAMMFASVGLVEERVVQKLGFLNKREARIVYYRRAKLLFDFGIERDPVRNAQASLILTYWSPVQNTERWNSFWLMNAIRFAKIAKADSFDRIPGIDSGQRSMLKRLWWCVILRDRILSLGVRRALQVTTLLPERNILRLEDFYAEMGRSAVHDAKTQQDIVMVLSAACEFAIAVTPALRVLYTYEDIEQRTHIAANSLRQTFDELQKCVERLEKWHSHCSQTRPFPISLDNSADSICIFGNLLFIYYSTTIVALHSFIVLLHPMLPPSYVPLRHSRNAIKAAIGDVTERTTDLMLVRLIQYLPISAAAYLLLPLILQGINSRAAQGTNLSTIENRKLEVFTKMLDSQQSSFDSADFCADLAHSITACVEEDAQDSTETSRPDSTATSHLQPGESNPGLSRGVQRMSTWEEILEKQPQLYLRVCFYVDMSLCTGVPPQTSSFESVFQFVESRKPRQ